MFRVPSRLRFLNETEQRDWPGYHALLPSLWSWGAQEGVAKLVRGCLSALPLPLLQYKPGWHRQKPCMAVVQKCCGGPEPKARETGWAQGEVTRLLPHALGLSGQTLVAGLRDMLRTNDQPASSSTSLGLPEFSPLALRMDKPAVLQMAQLRPQEVPYTVLQPCHLSPPPTPCSRNLEGAAAPQ